MVIYNIEIPQVLRRFSNEIVIGGEARLLAYCLIHQIEWPEGYAPRDQDYLVEDPSSQEKGILRNEGGPTASGKVIDRLVVSSLEDYFGQIDLHTNGVAVVYNHTLKITQEALKCFVEGEVRMNLEHPKLKSVSYWEYLALRACIQTGWDVEEKKYHTRAGACRLHRSIKNQLDPNSLRDNWYWPTYLRKLAQVKTGKH